MKKTDRESEGTRRCGTGSAILTRDEIATIVRELADAVAPADVVRLMEAEGQLRRRARALSAGRLRLFGKELLLSLDLLRDHLDDRCPHIPLHTVSTLAAAVAYTASEIDLVPDFLPRLGQLDDAAVMAVAHEIAAPGIERYRAWKGVSEKPARQRRSVATRRPATTRPRRHE